MSDVIVIGVAGGTGSGKTTLVKALMNRFGDNISVLSHDNYYKRHDEMSYEERTHLNYDCPDAFDTDMMIEHLRMLKNGQAIDCPTYDYTIHNRADGVLHIERSRNSIIGVSRNPMAEQYPVGTVLPVWFDPQKPQRSYVLRCVDNRWVFWMLLLLGAVLLAGCIGVITLL